MNDLLKTYYMKNMKVQRCTRFFRSRFLFVCALLALAAAGCDRGSQPQHIGKLAPAFTIQDGSQTVRLDQYRGQVVLLNFWATWCPPCVDELPSLIALHHRLPQLVILGVSADQDADAYQRFLLDYHVDFPTIRQPSLAIQHLYGTQQIPETYVIDRQGHLIRKFVSSQDWTSPDILRYLYAVVSEK